MHQDNFRGDAYHTTLNNVSTTSTNATSIDPVVYDNQQDEECDVKIGIVTNCKKLNIRKEPKPDAAIIGNVDCQTELMIDETESTDDFYKICTATGIEGFCMRKFVTVGS